MWPWLKRMMGWERSAPPPDKHEAEKLPVWIDAPQSGWGVPVLDVRPVTQTMMSFTTDRKLAENAVSYYGQDGSSFVGQSPAVQRITPASLTFRTDQFLADGVLFVPAVMEHKWYITYHRERIYFVRSWLRQVHVTADVDVNGNNAQIVSLNGTFTSDDELPEFTERVADYLLHSHALEVPFPVPIPTNLESNPKDVGLWCFTCFGNLAHFATPHAIARSIPHQPLRTNSVLHIAVVRGDVKRIQELLDSGMPVELRAPGGGTPLHWAAVQDDTSILDILTERGAQIDARTDDGATPVMLAAQNRKLAQVECLLKHGADPSAQDHRGFTALHRAAEMGECAIAEALLSFGASPGTIAQGHTARSLAEARKEAGIVRLLDRFTA